MMYGDPYSIKLWRVPCDCGHDWWSWRERMGLLVLRRTPQVFRRAWPLRRFFFQPEESAELKRRVDEFLEEEA